MTEAELMENALPAWSNFTTAFGPFERLIPYIDKGSTLTGLEIAELPGNLGDFLGAIAVFGTIIPNRKDVILKTTCPAFAIGFAASKVH
jgi:hypothetical protein